MRHPRVLLTGGSGQVGSALTGLTDLSLSLDAPGRELLNLEDAEALNKRVLDGDYVAVINSGAYTAVDAAESDVSAAWKSNALAPASLASACRERGIPLVHISTDYVFSGQGEQPYSPGDPIAPLSVYGASKAAGEVAIRSSGCRHAILRTSWVISATGRNFVLTMLALARKQSRIRVVADQHGSPTAARDLARAVAVVTERMISEPNRASGTWHVASEGEASWYEVAEHIFASAGGALAKTTVEPIAAVEYPTPARRPANSRLDTRSLERDFMLTMPDWREAVALIVAEIEGGIPS